MISRFKKIKHLKESISSDVKEKILRLFKLNNVNVKDSYMQSGHFYVETDNTNSLRLGDLLDDLRKLEESDNIGYEYEENENGFYARTFEFYDYSEYEESLSKSKKNLRKFVESYLLEDEKGIRYEFKIWGHNPKSHYNREFEGWLEYSDGVLSIDFYVNQAKQLMSAVTKLLKHIFKIDNIDIRDHVWYEEYSQDKYYKNIEYTAKGKFTLNITEEEFNAQVSLFKDSLENLNKVGLLNISGVRFEGGPEEQTEMSESKVEYRYPESLYMTRSNSREYGINPKLIPSEGTGLSLWEYDPSGKKKYVTYQSDFGKLIKIYADFLNPKKVVIPESREGD